MMTLHDIQQIFNRAWQLTFCKKKLLVVSVILALCGLLVVFFRGIAIHASQWIGLSLTFIPLFLCSGVLLSTGIFLVRVYHDEVKNKEVLYSEIFGKSWEILTAASYFAIPIILCYLVLWMTLGVFVLLKEIPAIGDFFAAILAFAPFLLNLCTLGLSLVSLLLLYFLAPLMALKSSNRLQLTTLLVKRLQSNQFYNLLLGVIAVFPLLFCLSILSIAAFLTDSVFQIISEKPFYLILQSFFIMVPFVVLLSPAVVFFFNFATESHLLMRKLDTKSKDS